MMRILHISDLHFGLHNDNLKSNLEVRLATLKPNLIVATGDLADQPDEMLLSQAREFLRGLAKHCVPSEPEAPTLLVVPGNHDVKDWGLLGLWNFAYKKVFAEIPTNFYYRQENVWVYGLDSCGKGGVGANGFVHAKELVLFDKIYHQHKQDRETRFDSAFKIVLLHHHALPLKYDSTHQRWLTLDNAGEFLGEMLKHQIDLVLHGHEHVQARCRYGRALRNNPNGQVQVVAVGATLKQGESNSFHLITVEQGGEVRLDLFGADGSVFDQDPETVQLRALPAALGQVFGQWVGHAGYRCRKVASITILSRDGDAHRIVECEDLEILNETKDRAYRHWVNLSTTAGYIDLPRALPFKSAPVGLRLVPDAASSTEQSVRAVIDYGVHLTRNQKISYRYDWWAVNAFAMNERELRLKYGLDVAPVEFTYYPVEDPIDELLIVLQLPRDLPLPQLDVFVGRPQQITHLSDWEHEPRIETMLRDAEALQYVDSLKLAALRVRQPEQGWYYGIQWKLPAPPSRASGPKSGQVMALVNKLLTLGNSSEDEGDLLLLLLRSLADLLRAKLIPGWQHGLEVSLAVLDEENSKMVVVAAANVGVGSPLSPLHYSAVHFKYGEGIVGKAFKTNEYRLYERVRPEERETPDFYRERPGSTRHEVLLAIPVQNPDENQQIYGVLNFGSDSSGCPLRSLASPEPQTLLLLRNLQAAINTSCFEFLTGAWQ